MCAAAQEGLDAYVARQVALDHNISVDDAADALADVTTQQRFAFLTAGFRPRYLHWHVVS